MQNKGLVKFFALALTLVCLFYLSFSFVTRYHTKKAAQDPQGVEHYMDSMANKKVYLGYTLKKCREMEIGLGLDLKGGMNVILEVSVPDVIKALADHKSDEAFNQAVSIASKQSVTSQEDFVTLFIREYKRLAPEGKLAELFATQQLKDKVNTRSTDAEVEKVLREEVKAAIDNSFNVLRTRIDRFGVVQPNIQNLEGSMGRIMVELPGIKEPERVRKLLQGSANLEFWETYYPSEVYPYLTALDSRLRDNAVVGTDTTTVKAETPEVKTSTDSLSAVLNAENAQSREQIEQMKKEHPLLAILQLNNQQGGAIAGYADYRDTAAINTFIRSKEAESILPKDLRLKWSVAASDLDKSERIFELYAIKVTERSGRAPLEGDVITDARDTYDQRSNPAVSMSILRFCILFEQPVLLQNVPHVCSICLKYFFRGSFSLLLRTKNAACLQNLCQRPSCREVFRDCCLCTFRGIRRRQDNFIVFIEEPALCSRIDNDQEPMRGGQKNVFFNGCLRRSADHKITVLFLVPVFLHELLKFLKRKSSVCKDDLSANHIEPSFVRWIYYCYFRVSPTVRGMLSGSPCYPHCASLNTVISPFSSTAEITQETL